MHGGGGSGGGGDGEGGDGGGAKGDGAEGGGSDGGSTGGKGGGGVHSAESPANSKLRPVQLPVPEYDTENVASMYPSSGRKKNCMPRLAWSAVSAFGSVGLSPESPRAVAVNM